MIDLKPFCRLESMFRGDKFERPFSEGDFTFATNGHIAIRVEKREDVAPLPESALNKIMPMFEQWPGDAIFTGLDAIKRLKWTRCDQCAGEGRVIPCETCEGQGEVVCETCGHESDCEDCVGSGYLPLWPFDENTIASKSILCPRCHGLKWATDVKVVQLAPGSAFNPVYLRLIDSLPNARIAFATNPLASSYFIFDGGDGLLMPMRASETDVRLYDEAAFVEAKEAREVALATSCQ